MVSLKIAVKDNKLIKVKDTMMIEDTINGVKCHFEFRSDWSNLKSTIVFARGHIYPCTEDPKTIPAFLDENNECIVPPEIISESGEFSIGLFGESDAKNIVTNWLHYKTKWGCYDVGVAPNPPTPSAYDKILTALQDKSDKDHNHDDIYMKQEDADEVINDHATQIIKDVLNISNDIGYIDAGSIIDFEERS